MSFHSIHFLFLRGNIQNEKLIFLFGAIPGLSGSILKLISFVQHWVIAVTGPGRARGGEREVTGVG
jgi:hypothetical protein